MHLSADPGRYEAHTATRMAKDAGAAPVPQALVDLAIHWAGAFIVYVSDAVPAG
jgi:diacylglycerol kinase